MSFQRRLETCFVSKKNVIDDDAISDVDSSVDAHYLYYPWTSHWMYVAFIEQRYFREHCKDWNVCLTVCSYLNDWSKNDVRREWCISSCISSENWRRPEICVRDTRVRINGNRFCSLNVERRYFHGEASRQSPNCPFFSRKRSSNKWIYLLHIRFSTSPCIQHKFVEKRNLIWDNELINGRYPTSILQK
jgi:hypothetical protein